MASAIFECINSNNNEPNKKKKIILHKNMGLLKAIDKKKCLSVT